MFKFEFDYVNIENVLNGVLHWNAWVGIYNKVSVSKAQVAFNFNSDRIKGTGVDNKGQTGTSVTMNSCYSNSCTNGFFLNWLSYSTLNSCACDSASVAYRCSKSQLTFNSGGQEVTKDIGFNISNSHVVINSGLVTNSTLSLYAIYTKESKVTINNQYWTSNGTITLDLNSVLAVNNCTIDTSNIVFNNIAQLVITEGIKTTFKSYNGSEYITTVKNHNFKESGTTANRPSIGTIEPGTLYYDTTLKKYICWNGTAWTNVNGGALT